jgi:hypothetical protein
VAIPSPVLPTGDNYTAHEKKSQYFFSEGGCVSMPQPAGKESRPAEGKFFCGA